MAILVVAHHLETRRQLIERVTSVTTAHLGALQKAPNSRLQSTWLAAEMSTDITTATKAGRLGLARVFRDCRMAAAYMCSPGWPALHCQQWVDAVSKVFRVEDERAHGRPQDCSSESVPAQNWHWRGQVWLVPQLCSPSWCRRERQSRLQEAHCNPQAIMHAFISTIKSLKRRRRSTKLDMLVEFETNLSELVLSQNSTSRTLPLTRFSRCR